MVKLSIKMLKREYKGVIFYLVSMILAIMMTFTFFSIVFNQSLESTQKVVGGTLWA